MILLIHNNNHYFTITEQNKARGRENFGCTYHNSHMISTYILTILQQITGLAFKKSMSPKMAKNVQSRDFSNLGSMLCRQAKPVGNIHNLAGIDHLIKGLACNGQTRFFYF